MVDGRQQKQQSSCQTTESKIKRLKSKHSVPAVSRRRFTAVLRYRSFAAVVTAACWFIAKLRHLSI